MDASTQAAESLPRWRRRLYAALGLFFLGLAVLGVVLPVLPTTPFVLLASFFFVRSTPSLNAWLLRSRLFGPMLRDWQHRRGVRRRVKVLVLVVMPLVAGISALLGQLDWPWLAVLAGLVAIGMLVVYRLPVIADPLPAPALDSTIELAVQTNGEIGG